VLNLSATQIEFLKKKGGTNGTRSRVVRVYRQVPLRTIEEVMPDDDGYSFQLALEDVSESNVRVRMKDLCTPHEVAEIISKIQHNLRNSSWLGRKARTSLKIKATTAREDANSDAEDQAELTFI
jgi:hypothetical protein